MSAWVPPSPGLAIGSQPRALSDEIRALTTLVPGELSGAGANCIIISEASAIGGLLAFGPVSAVAQPK
jgi:hypothetical protein